MRNTKSKIIIMMCAVLCIMAVGYAAFSTVLTITGTANITSEWKVVFTKIEQVSKTSGVNIKSTPVASGTTATFDVGLTSPGDKIVYKITLANQGTIDAVIKNIGASATDSPAIIFTVEGVNTGDVINNKTSKDFTVTIEYDPHVTSQPDKLQKTLTVSIVTEQYVNQSIDASTPNVNQPTYLSSAILRDNIAYADTNIDFSQTSEATGTNGLYYTNTNTENNLTTYYFRGAVDNNYVQFGKQAGCGYNGQAIFHIIDLNNNNATVKPTEEQCLSTNICDAGTLLKEEVGLDYRYVTGVDAATCSYMGGTYLTEKATYGNDAIDRIWRIVRINEDRSIRLIYQGYGANTTGSDATIGYMVFNTEEEDNAYVGYMYGTVGATGDNAYNLTHTNTTSSTMKTFLDEWYVNNLSSYSSYLADAGFCNDRSVAPSAGVWATSDTALGYAKNTTHYGVYNRLKNEKQPQYACPNEGRDLFTTSTSTKGNNALTYPIGLLTADEAMYAGALYQSGNNQNFYLANSEPFWTMSPSSYYEYARGIFVGTKGYMGSYDKYDNLYFARPVINLMSTVEIIGGNGTSGNPYVVKTN